MTAEAIWELRDAVRDRNGRLLRKERHGQEASQTPGTRDYGVRACTVVDAPGTGVNGGFAFVGRITVTLGAKLQGVSADQALGGRLSSLVHPVPYSLRAYTQ